MYSVCFTRGYFFVNCYSLRTKLAFIISEGEWNWNTDLRMKSLVGHLRFAIASLRLSVLLAVFEYPMLISRDFYTSFISPFSP